MCFRASDGNIKVDEEPGTANFDLVCDVMEDNGGEVAREVKNKQIRTFKKNSSSDEIIDASKKKFAPQSKRKMKWVLNMFDEWRNYRMKQESVPIEVQRCDLNRVGQFSEFDLCFVLARFICEIKRIDDSEYPPNTLREIIVMIQMHLNENGIFWKLLEHTNFQPLRNVVDNTMKERTALGLGSRVSSKIISMENEDKLFSSKCLGDENPQQLLYTVIYMMGMHLALRGGIEHNRLRRPGFELQISVSVDSRGKECLIYQEDPLQKTNQGGLKCKLKKKIIYVYPSDNVERCPVRIYKKYIGLLPPLKACKKLYMRVKQKSTPKVWFCDQPLGANKVASAVKDLCKQEGLVGQFTNHSLRATSASRMYHSGIPEQVIKEVTGHRSDCVRICKRTCDDIRQKASETIAGVGLNSESKQLDEEVKVDESNTNGLSMVDMVKNVLKTKAEIAKKQFGVKFNIAKCKNMIARKIVRNSKLRKFTTQVMKTERKKLLSMSMLT